MKIIDFYTKKEKQLEQQKRLQQSQFINNGRLVGSLYFHINDNIYNFQKILKACEEHISSVNQKATAQLAQLSQNKAEYQNMLEKLWTQESEWTLLLRKLSAFLKLLGNYYFFSKIIKMTIFK